MFNKKSFEKSFQVNMVLSNILEDHSTGFTHSCTPKLLHAVILAQLCAVLPNSFKYSTVFIALDPSKVSLHWIYVESFCIGSKKCPFAPDPSRVPLLEKMAAPPVAQ